MHRRVCVVLLLVLALAAQQQTAQAFPASFLSDVADRVKSATTAVLDATADALKSVADNVFPEKFPADRKFDYQAAVKGKDSRAPCPALNTLANHGYLNRDGRNITRADLVRALVHRMGVSSPAANLLAAGAFPRLAKNGVLDLADLATHNVIEHDASLTRYDAALSNNEQAVFRPDRFQKLLTFSSDKTSLTLDDLARARTFFNKESEANNKQYTWNFQLSFNAKGESIALTNVLGRDNKISLEYVKSFFEREQFPADWKTPNPTIGVVKVLRRVFEFNDMLKRAGGEKYV